MLRTTFSIYSMANTFRNERISEFAVNLNLKNEDIPKRFKLKSIFLGRILNRVYDRYAQCATSGVDMSMGRNMVSISKNSSAIE